MNPARGGNYFEIMIFELINWIDILRNSHEIVLWRMPKYQFHDESTLVQVMAWCQQATCLYLSQCWPSSWSPYGVTRPQWVKTSSKKIGKKTFCDLTIFWTLRNPKKKPTEQSLISIGLNISDHVKFITRVWKYPPALCCPSSGRQVFTLGRPHDWLGLSCLHQLMNGGFSDQQIIWLQN